MSANPLIPRDDPRIGIIADKLIGLCAERPDAAIAIVTAAVTGASFGLHVIDPSRGSWEEVKRLTDPGAWEERYTPAGLLATISAGAPDAEAMARGVSLSMLEGIPTLAVEPHPDFTVASTSSTTPDDDPDYEATRLDLDQDETTRDDPEA